ncbi:MAG: hypothetical protein IJX75_01910 [Clostridia bacterium]|nr:hypothetical protein [Clostridia bacterium]
MKSTRKQLFVLTAFLLFFLTLFSVLFVRAEFKTHCDHQTSCDYCAELAFEEQVLSDTIETHGACQSSCCNTCDFIELQQISLEKARAEKHVCAETLCADCLHMQTLRKTLKIVFLRVIISLLTVATVGKTLLQIYKKEKTQNGFSLIALKVKLTD